MALIDILKIAIPVSGSILGSMLFWFCNERQKRRANDYLRRETNYRTFILAAEGFYNREKCAEERNVELISNFITQLNLAWLYSPDDVIEKGYVFLESVTSSANRSAIEREEALGDFIAAVRRDLLANKSVTRTMLSGRSYKLYKTLDTEHPG